MDTPRACTWTHARTHAHATTPLHAPAPNAQALAAMVKLELPHINLLTKMDL